MKLESDILTPDAPPGSDPCSGSAMRPYEEQSPLERVLRSHLWQPQYHLALARQNLPQHVKRKKYREAAECQALIVKAELEIKEWEHLLELYEQERKSPNADFRDSAT